MATAKSFSDLNWLSKTFSPPQVSSWGMTSLAADLSGAPTINTSPRLASAIAYMNAREAEVWVAYRPSWDATWSSAGEPLFQQFLAAMPSAMIESIVVDPDPNALLALKSFLRALQMLYLQFLVGG